MITKEQVKHIANLARLQLTDEEVVKYQQDLSLVLDYFDTLESAKVDDVEPMIHSLVGENITREDVAVQDAPKVTVALLKLMPAVKDGFLKVKTILLQK